MFILENKEYKIADSEFWYLVENVFDFVLCFKIDSGEIIRKKGFDKVCVILDSYTNYYDLIKEYHDTYVNELYRDTFKHKTSVDYILKNNIIVFTGLENIENNQLRWYEYTIVSKENVATILIRDIHDIKTKECELEKKSTIDKMTNCYNRLAIDDIIDEKLTEDKKNFAIIFIDIDDFKYINDSYGHLKGDEVLKEVAIILKEFFQGENTVGRYGGDEFLIYVDNISSVDQVIPILNKLYEKIANPLECGIKITLSTGISIYPSHGKTRKDLYHAADIALYNAKRSGKKCYKAADL